MASSTKSMICRKAEREILERFRARVGASSASAAAAAAPGPADASARLKKPAATIAATGRRLGPPTSALVVSSAVVARDRTLSTGSPPAKAAVTTAPPPAERSVREPPQQQQQQLQLQRNSMGSIRSVERQLRSLIREHHRLIEAAEQLSSPAADSKLRAATKLQQEIINKAYQLKQVSEVYRDAIRGAAHINAELALPKSLAQKLIAHSTALGASNDAADAPSAKVGLPYGSTTGRLAVTESNRHVENEEDEEEAAHGFGATGGGQRDEGSITLRSFRSCSTMGGDDDRGGHNNNNSSSNTNNSGRQSDAKIVTLCTSSSTSSNSNNHNNNNNNNNSLAGIGKSEPNAKLSSLAMVSGSSLLVPQQQTNGLTTTSPSAAAAGCGLKLAPTSTKPALLIIKMPPNQAGQLNIVTVPHLNSVNNRNGAVTGITGVVNGAVSSLPVNGTVVVNNLGGLANLNSTLGSVLNGGHSNTISNNVNNQNSISKNNNNNNINTTNNNNALQLNNCKIVSVTSPVAVQKVAVQSTESEKDEPETDVTIGASGQRMALSSVTRRIDRLVTSAVESTTATPTTTEIPSLSGAGLLFEKVARTHEQQTWFLAHLGLCTRQRHRELFERRRERRRRKTANPHFSAAAMEERRRLESLRRKKKLVIPDGKSKLEFKEELEQRADKLTTERDEMLKKHEEAQRQLDAERSRTQKLREEHRSMEETLERLRSVITSIVEERSPVKCT